LSTATILSSAWLPSIIRSPPMGIASTSTAPWVMGFSVSTHTSIGSPSPVMPLRPSRCEQRSPTALSQNVRGMKPYRLGGWLEKRCGRSSFKMPVALSTSYLTASVGTISM